MPARFFVLAILPYCYLFIIQLFPAMLFVTGLWSVHAIFIDDCLCRAAQLHLFY